MEKHTSGVKTPRSCGSGLPGMNPRPSRFWDWWLRGIPPPARFSLFFSADFANVYAIDSFEEVNGDRV